MNYSGCRFIVQSFKSQLLKICILSLSLVVMPSALAESTFKPPPDSQPPSDYTTSSGPRGGCDGDGIPLTALAPKTDQGQTLSTYPTLAWFVPDSTSKPMEFRLYEFDAQGKLKLVGQPIQLESSPGIMRLSLAREQLELTVGTTYLWQVTIRCDPDNDSSDLIVRANLQVVEMPLALAQKLAQVQPGLATVELYAGAGFWYDALAEALQFAPPWQLGEVGASPVRELVNLEAAKTSPESLTSANEAGNPKDE